VPGLSRQQCLGGAERGRLRVPVQGGLLWARRRRVRGVRARAVQGAGGRGGLCVLQRARIDAGPRVDRGCRVPLHAGLRTERAVRAGVTCDPCAADTYKNSTANAAWAPCTPHSSAPAGSRNVSMYACDAEYVAAGDGSCDRASRQPGAPTGRSSARAVRRARTRASAATTRAWRAPRTRSRTRATRPRCTRACASRGTRGQRRGRRLRRPTGASPASPTPPTPSTASSTSRRATRATTGAQGEARRRRAPTF
jgi:hypothetical protein